MSLEIRTLTSDEIEQAETINHQAFGTPQRFDMAAIIDAIRERFRPEWYLGAFENGEMTSMMRVLPFEAMRLNGGGLPFGAVSPVASSPLHRRKGHTGAMVRHSLQVMRDSGQPLSGLWTPHPAFYRRYGWEAAADERVYTFKPKDLRLTVEPSERGRLRFVTADAWPELDAIYTEQTRTRNGPLERQERWWRNAILGELHWPWFSQAEAVVWEDGAGVQQGYAVFVEPSSPHRDAGKLFGIELCALTADAYLNLVTFLAQHDLLSEIVIHAPSDDPLPLLFSDGERLDMKQNWTVMLRIIDVEAALRGRMPATPGLDLELTLAVTDQCAPWNQGTWRVRCADGTTLVDRVIGEGELRLDVLALAPVFNGYISPSRAADVGLLQASSEDALRRADAFFGVLHRPYFTDHF